MSKSVNNVQELGTLANSMTRDYSAIAGDCRGAVAASANPQVVTTTIIIIIIMTNLMCFSTKATRTQYSQVSTDVTEKF